MRRTLESFLPQRPCIAYDNAEMTEQLPFVATAVICERILQEEDGVLSLIRIVDTLMIDIPKEAPAGAPVPFAFEIAVNLKSEVSGKYSVRLVGRGPDVTEGRAVGEDIPVVLEGNGHGFNVRYRLNTAFKVSGLYWFDVQINGVVVTRIPLRVTLRRGGNGPTV